MLRHVRTVAALLMASLAVACSSGSSSEGKASPTASPTPSAAAPTLVGVWERVQTCPELEHVLTVAGMRQALGFMVATDGWVPGVTQPDQIKDPAHPCVGAAPRKHSHYFTGEGQFGSLNADGAKVDGDPYRLIEPDLLVIGDPGVRFHYRLSADGNTLALTPVIPPCRPACFEAQWSVVVAYPGYTWKRVG